MGSHAGLIAKLEQSPKGSRELSDAVLVAVRPNLWGWLICPQLGDVLEGKSLRKPTADMPDPTRDLQDAVDLVPSKWGWSIEDTGGGLVYLKKKIPGEHGHLILAEIDGGRRSPPIGMCIAILKAMETGDG